jgi:hypothetical protein
MTTSVADRQLHPVFLSLRDGRKVQIRRLGADDLDAFLELSRAVIADGRGVPQVPVEDFGPPERFIPAWEDDSGRELYLGAWLGGP